MTTYYNGNLSNQPHLSSSWDYNVGQSHTVRYGTIGKYMNEVASPSYFIAKPEFYNELLTPTTLTQRIKNMFKSKRVKDLEYAEKYYKKTVENLDKKINIYENKLLTLYDKYKAVKCPSTLDTFNLYPLQGIDREGNPVYASYIIATLKECEIADFIHNLVNPTTLYFKGNTSENIIS